MDYSLLDNFYFCNHFQLRISKNLTQQRSIQLLVDFKTLMIGTKKLLLILKQLLLDNQRLFSLLIMNTNLMNKSLSLAKVQESILQQYKRLCFGQENHQNQQISFVPYSDIPKFIPHQIAVKHKNCLLLGSISFFQMITFAFMEYLFRCRITVRQELIKNIRRTICDQKFLFGSGYIKGLLVKGLRIIATSVNDRQMPVLNYLQRQQYLLSFTQFWKQIIQMNSEQEFQLIRDQPQKFYFQQISNYTGICFKIHWAENDFQEQIIYPVSSNTVDNVCQILISKKYHFPNSSKLLQSQDRQQPAQYIVLLPQQRKLGSLQLQFTDKKEDLSFQSSQQYILLRARAWEAKKKGEGLVRQLRQFWTIIQQL